ncbi:MAG: hypothetical protein V1672_05135, partial [Candidatus Diapherotrites archaeon]
NIAGAGTDECTTNLDCAAPTHKECSGTSCIDIAGAGTDECTTNLDCGGIIPPKVEFLAIAYDDGLGKNSDLVKLLGTKFAGWGPKVYCLWVEDTLEDDLACYNMIKDQVPKLFDNTFPYSLLKLFPDMGPIVDAGDFRVLPAPPNNAVTMGFMQKGALFVWSLVTPEVGDPPLYYYIVDPPGGASWQFPEEWKEGISGFCDNKVSVWKSGRCINKDVVYLNRYTWNNDYFWCDADIDFDTYYSGNVKQDGGDYKDVILMIGRNTIPDADTVIWNSDLKTITWEGIVGSRYYGIEVYRKNADYDHECHNAVPDVTPLFKLSVNLELVDQDGSGLTRSGNYPWQYTLDLKKAKPKYYLPKSKYPGSIWNYLQEWILIDPDCTPKDDICEIQLKASVRACAIAENEGDDNPYVPDPDNPDSFETYDDTRCAWDMALFHLFDFTTASQPLAYSGRLSDPITALVPTDPDPALSAIRHLAIGYNQGITDGSVPLIYCRNPQAGELYEGLMSPSTCHWIATQYGLTDDVIRQFFDIEDTGDLSDSYFAKLKPEFKMGYMQGPALFFWNNALDADKYNYKVDPPSLVDDWSFTGYCPFGKWEKPYSSGTCLNKYVVALGYDVWNNDGFEKDSDEDDDATYFTGWAKTEGGSWDDPDLISWTVLRDTIPDTVWWGQEIIKSNHKLSVDRVMGAEVYSFDFYGQFADPKVAKPLIRLRISEKWNIANGSAKDIVTCTPTTCEFDLDKVTFEDLGMGGTNPKWTLWHGINAWMTSNGWTTIKMKLGAKACAIDDGSGNSPQGVDSRCGYRVNTLPLGLPSEVPGKTFLYESSLSTTKLITIHAD